MTDDDVDDDDDGVAFTFGAARPTNERLDDASPARLQNCPYGSPQSLHVCPKLMSLGGRNGGYKCGGFTPLRNQF